MEAEQVKVISITVDGVELFMQLSNNQIQTFSSKSLSELVLAGGTLL